MLLLVPKVFLLNFWCLNANPEHRTVLTIILRLTVYILQYKLFLHLLLNELDDIVSSSKTHIYITFMNLIHNNMRNAMKTVFKFPEKNPYRTIVK